MRIGVIFPQVDIEPDPVAIRDYAEAVEGMGYAHIAAYDHVLGASTRNRPDWTGPYHSGHAFHEPFVLFGYLAGLTRRVELVTAVMVLPQRQTVLVAKQAAEVDVLSGGRLRFGLGVGWNRVEYEALGEDFHTRGRRSAEQIRLLRELWTSEVVRFDGRWHRVSEAGLNPMPVQRPIPIWLGGHADATLKRVAELGDGWFPLRPPGDESRRLVERLRELLVAQGRDPEAIGIEARLRVAAVPAGDWEDYLAGWEALGATHLAVDTMNAGLVGAARHLDVLRDAARRLGVV